MTHFTHTTTTQQHRRAVTHQITDSHCGLWAVGCGRDLLEPRAINSCINMQTRQAAYGSKFTHADISTAECDGAKLALLQYHASTLGPGLGVSLGNV